MQAAVVKEDAVKGWPGEPEMDYDVMVADDAAAEAAGKPIENVIFDFGNVLIYWDPAAVLVPRYRWADILEYYVANFRDSLTGVVPGARVLVDDLKAAGVGVWGLSNWERGLYPIAEECCPILQRLDGKVVSGYVRLRKPHRDIYEYALREFGIEPSTAVFIDDKAMNIVGANAAGIRGIRFSDPRRLRDVLIEAGVDIPAVV